MNIYEFMGEHPILTTVLAFFISETIVRSTFAIVIAFRGEKVEGSE